MQICKVTSDWSLWSGRRKNCLSKSTWLHFMAADNWTVQLSSCSPKNNKMSPIDCSTLRRRTASQWAAFSAAVGSQVRALCSVARWRRLNTRATEHCHASRLYTVALCCFSEKLHWLFNEWQSVTLVTKVVTMETSGCPGTCGARLTS